MRHLLRTTALVSLVAAGLAACDGGGGGGGDVIITPPPPPPPAGSTRLEDTFGANFGAAFRLASLTSDPILPQAGDVNGVSFTTDPTPIP